MKCILIVNTPNKEAVQRITCLSCVQKVKDGHTYLWYYKKNDAREDARELKKYQGVECTLKEGWEHDGFVTYNI